MKYKQIHASKTFFKTFFSVKKKRTHQSVSIKD